MAGDFGSNESLESEGILDAFRVLQAAKLGQKIRQPGGPVTDKVHPPVFLTVGRTLSFAQK